MKLFSDKNRLKEELARKGVYDGNPILKYFWLHLGDAIVRKVKEKRLWFGRNILYMKKELLFHGIYVLFLRV